MNICKILSCCILAAVTATTLNSAEKKKPAASKTNANYRQSYSKKSTTVTNPYAITAKKKEKEDPAATKLFKAFVSNYWKARNGKKFSAIYTGADKLISSQKKLTTDQKTQIYYFKADAYLAEKKYANAIKTAETGIKQGGDAAGSCAAVIINAAAAEKKFDAADKAIAAFESSKLFADGNYYNAITNLRFSQNRYDDAFASLKLYGKQPNLNNGDKIKILTGFAKYYIEKKNYANAIAQYQAIKSLPKIDPYNEGNADLLTASCYLKMKNKDKALEIYRSLTKAKHAKIRTTAQNEIKKLTAKPKPAAKKKSSAKKNK